MRIAPSSGPAAAIAFAMPCGDVVGVDEQRRARAERVELGGERRLLVVVQQRERVRRGAGGRDAVAPRRREVGRRREPGQVRRAGRRDGRLLVRAARAHLDDRTPARRDHHARRRRRDRAVVVEDRQHQRLEHDRLGERPGHREDRRVREVQLALAVAVDVPAEPVRREVVRRAVVHDAGRRAGTSTSAVVEAEVGDGVEQRARCRPPRRSAGRPAGGARTPRTCTAGPLCRRAGPSPASSARTGR